MISRKRTGRRAKNEEIGGRGRRDDKRLEREEE